MDAANFSCAFTWSDAPKIPLEPWEIDAWDIVDGVAQETYQEPTLIYVPKIAEEFNGDDVNIEIAILKAIVDLEYWSPSKIALFLQRTMDRHCSPKYRMARIKWAEDIEFIQNYKVNPQRFLIAR